jgi:hypothetical protein
MMDYWSRYIPEDDGRVSLRCRSCDEVFYLFPETMNEYLTVEQQVAMVAGDPPSCFGGRGRRT